MKSIQVDRSSSILLPFLPFPLKCHSSLVSNDVVLLNSAQVSKAPPAVAVV